MCKAEMKTGEMLEQLQIAELIVSLSSRAMSVVHFVRNYLYPAPPAPYWVERLNTIYPNEVCIHRVLDVEPVLELADPLKLSNEEARIASKYRKIPKNNEPVAVYAPPTVWADNPVVLRAHPTDYAAVCALDELGRRPPILSASALLYCRDTEELILHRRSMISSRDYAGFLHTFGGGYIPPGNHIRDYDHLSLVRAARRETTEESGIVFEISRLPKLLLGEELKIGFVHLALLGIGISKSNLDTAMSNHEGKISRLKAADLPRRLHDSDWVPAGKIQVLAWLALGAPIGRRRVRFGKASGQEIFNEFLATFPSLNHHPGM